MKTVYNATNETNRVNDTWTQGWTLATSVTSYQVVSLGIVVLETIIGTFMNGLMVAVNLISLLTHRKLSACDSILTCLGLSRFTFMWLVLVVYFVSYLLPNVTDMGSDLQYAWLFLNDLTLWFATWLCTFYCVRIVNIQRNLFTAFKTHFDHMVPFLLLGSVAISASCSNSATYNGVSHTLNMSRFDDNNKKSPPFSAMGKDFATFMTLSVAGSIPPFFLFCVSAGLVVYSLLSHMKRMKGQERTGFREPSLRAHWRAVRMMALFFIFFLLYMVAFNLYGSGKVEGGIVSCVTAFLIGAYPALHSVLLVIGNHNLKHSLLWILQKGHCQKEVIQTISD
ncbi:taste receptor type 2 member 1-like [Leptodactylus fuscus]